jgi:hypothetical protein
MDNVYKMKQPHDWASTARLYQHSAPLPAQHAPTSTARLYQHSAPLPAQRPLPAQPASTSTARPLPAQRASTTRKTLSYNEHSYSIYHLGQAYVELAQYILMDLNPPVVVHTRNSVFNRLYYSCYIVFYVIGRIYQLGHVTHMSNHLYHIHDSGKHAAHHHPYLRSKCIVEQHPQT